MSVPNQMLYFANKLKDYETTPLRIFPLNYKDSYGPSEQIQFELPANSLVDLDSLFIDFIAGTEDTGNARLPADIHKLIRRVQVSSGGQDLGFAYDEFARLKNGLDAVTGRKPHPTSHPIIRRKGLNPGGGTFTLHDQERQETIDAAKALVPTLYSTTVSHLHLTAPLDGGANGVTPVDGSVNIIGKHSATKLSVIGFDHANQQVMNSTAFTWAQLAAVLEADGAQLKELFELLEFTNFTTDPTMEATIQAALDAVAAAEAIAPYTPESTAETANVRFTIDKLSGFLETAQPRQIDLSLLPTILITLHLNTPVCIVNTLGDSLTEFIDGEPQVGFEIKDPQLHITAIGFGNNSYDSYISAVMGKRGLQIPFKNYRHFTMGDFGSSFDFTCATRSLDRIHWQLSDTSIVNRREHGCKLAYGYVPMRILQDSGAPNPQPAVQGYIPNFVYKTGEKYVAEKYNISYDGRASTGNDANTPPRLDNLFQFNINSTPMPSFPCDGTQWYKMTTNALSEQRNPWDAQLDFPEWARNYAHCTLRLNRPGSTVQSASGLDTRNTVIENQLLVTASSLGFQACTCHLWAEFTSVLRVGADRAFSVEI